jgi:putative transposase
VQYFGTARWAWNACLAWRSNLYAEFNESVSAIDFSRELTELKKLETYEWVNNSPSTIITQALRDQDTAFKKFLKKAQVIQKLKSATINNRFVFN